MREPSQLLQSLGAGVGWLATPRSVRRKRQKKETEEAKEKNGEHLLRKKREMRDERCGARRRECGPLCDRILGFL